jgi:hypothetical protein
LAIADAPPGSVAAPAGSVGEYAGLVKDGLVFTATGVRDAYEAATGERSAAGMPPSTLLAAIGDAAGRSAAEMPESNALAAMGALGVASATTGEDGAYRLCTGVMADARIGVMADSLVEVATARTADAAGAMAVRARLKDASETAPTSTDGSDWSNTTTPKPIDVSARCRTAGSTGRSNSSSMKYSPG